MPYDRAAAGPEPGSDPGYVQSRVGIGPAKSSRGSRPILVWRGSDLSVYETACGLGSAILGATEGVEGKLGPQEARGGSEGGSPLELQVGA